MNLTEETLGPNGGFKKNNLKDIFHLEDEYINEDDFKWKPVLNYPLTTMRLILLNTVTCIKNL